MDRRKALLQDYKENPPAMGVWAVTNTAEGKVLLGASPNAQGRLNRERFALENGSHFNKTLVADWRRLGCEAFTFEVLDTLDASDDPDSDPAEELETLRQMWLDRLGLSDEQLYTAR